MERFATVNRPESDDGKGILVEWERLPLVLAFIESLNERDVEIHSKRATHFGAGSSEYVISCCPGLRSKIARLLDLVDECW